MAKKMAKKKAVKKSKAFGNKKTYKCAECGLVVRIIKECNCDGGDCDLVCCDELMCAE